MTEVQIQPTGQGTTTRRRRAGGLALLVLLACAGVYLVGNNRMALFDRDEGWYAEVARNMLASGDWVVPRCQGAVFDTKPVFAFWCQAVSMGIFGPSEFAARFPGVFFSILTLILVYWAANFFAGVRRALWTIAILGTGALFMAMAKSALVDAEQMFFIAVAEICLAFLYSGRRGYWICMILWVSSALAILTKGPVVLGTLAGTMLALAVLDVGKKFHSPRAWIRATKWWWATKPWLALLVVPVVVGPWLFMIHQRDPAFLSIMLQRNFLGPIFEKPLNDRRTIPGFYLMIIWPCFMPWSLILPLTFVQSWRNRGVPAIRFCLAAVVGPLVVIELVKQKLPHYLLPLAPPLAFLMADAIVHVLRHRVDDLKTGLAKIAVSIWTICVVLCALAPWVLLIPKYHVPFSPLAAGIFTLIGAGLAIWIARSFWQRRFRLVFVGMCAGSMAVMAVLAALLIPSVQPLLAAKQAAGAMWADGYKIGDRVVLMDYTEPSISFYLKGGGMIEDDNYLNVIQEANWPTWLVTSSLQRDRMPASQLAEYTQVGTFQAWNTGASRGNRLIVVLRRNSPG